MPERAQDTLQQTMKTFRPIHIEPCSICGEEFDKLTMHEIFTGRKQYICTNCRNRGNRQIDARQKDWRNSSRGKAVIEHCNKKRKS